MFELAKKLGEEDEKVSVKSSPKSPSKKKSNYTTNAALQSLGFDEAGTTYSLTHYYALTHILIYSDDNSDDFSDDSEQEESNERKNRNFELTDCYKCSRYDLLTRLLTYSLTYSLTFSLTQGL